MFLYSAQKLTNHLVAKDDNGFWTVGKRRYDTQISDLAEFMEHFKGAVDKWCVTLSARAHALAG